jgi:outer membrane protein assembly factor BamE
MQKTVRLLLTAILLTALGGCSYLKFPGVYKIVIQQGNVITQDMINELEPGMTRRQVRFVLGTPLIDDPFADERWDYFYSYTNPNGREFTHYVTVVFEEDQIDYLVASEEFTIPEALLPQNASDTVPPPEGIEDTSNTASSEE